MKVRHLAREAALQILYAYDLALESMSKPYPAGENLVQDLVRHFEHFRVPEEARAFAGELVAGTLTRTAELDQTLEKHAKNWKLSRMAYIDRNLLRMAANELIHHTSTPTTVVIDEAIELAKQFGTVDSSAFVNGILDSIRIELGRIDPPFGEGSENGG